ncbi:hypothetical protein [Desulforhopalus sp. 52FAK]
MNQFIHYFALLFIVFVCAEIRNVLIYETPYDSEPISIWSESVSKNPLEQDPAVKSL